MWATSNHLPTSQSYVMSRNEGHNFPSSLGQPRPRVGPPKSPSPFLLRPPVDEAQSTPASPPTVDVVTSKATQDFDLLVAVFKLKAPCRVHTPYELLFPSRHTAHASTAHHGLAPRRRRCRLRRGARRSRRGVGARVRPPPPVLPRGQAVGRGAGPPGGRVVGARAGLAGALLRAGPPRPRPPRARRRRKGPPHVRRRQHHIPPRRIAALRGGGGGHAAGDVPGGAGHRQQPLLGALRLQALRAHGQQRVDARARSRAPAVQPAELVDEQAGGLRPRALRPAQRLRRRQRQQLPVHGEVRLRQHLLLRGAGGGRGPPHPGEGGRGRRRRGGGAGGAGVRAGADGRVPGRRRRGRPAGPRHRQGVRAQRAGRRRPRRLRQLLHVLQPGRLRPHQLRRRRPPRPGRDALHRQEHTPDVQHQRDGDQRGGEGGGGGVRRHGGLRHVLHLPQRPGLHGPGHQLRLPGPGEEGQRQRLHPLRVLLRAEPRADGGAPAGGEPDDRRRSRVPGHRPHRPPRQGDQRRPGRSRRLLPRRAQERHRRRHHRTELHDRPQGGVRQGEVRPGLAQVRLLQGRSNGGRRREPQRGARAVAGGSAEAAADGHGQRDAVPRRGAGAPEAGRLRRQPPCGRPTLLRPRAAASPAGRGLMVGVRHGSVMRELVYIII